MRLALATSTGPADWGLEIDASTVLTACEVLEEMRRDRG